MPARGTHFLIEVAQNDRVEMIEPWSRVAISKRAKQGWGAVVFFSLSLCERDESVPCCRKEGR